ncbi:MAG: hypothetical protein KDH15_05920 [Rhodocyclaceae bacterium]|nr:hypothetical protein [Rhodocyclaceae bacterium]
MHAVPSLRLLFLCAALVVPAAARAASFASSASSASSASIGSVSDSFGASSDSSGSDDEVAKGDYRVTEVAQASERVDYVTVTLHSDERQRGFKLDLPLGIWTDQGLKHGDLVHVEPRPYGFEFARGDTRDAFYLVLNDDWYGELAARPLGNP